jgi:thiol-disulfide isomerase/thioredoxin
LHLLLALLLVAQPAPAASSASAAEARVVEYLRAHVEPGQPVVVSELYNNVFTTLEERAALNRLFNTFFKIPLFAAQQQKATGRPPTLAQISEQFRFDVPGQADVMLRIMESDPRMPRFLERDAKTGEITRVDVDAVLAHPRFGKALERSISGWQGREAPAFSATAYDGTTVSSQTLAGKPHVLYFWFTGCPPCVRTSPLLVNVQRELASQGLVTVALNADRFLELGTTDESRAAYAKRNGLDALVLAHADAATHEAHGSVSVYPTIFYVDRKRTVVRQLVNAQDEAALREAAKLALQ